MKNVCFYIILTLLVHRSNFKLQASEAPRVNQSELEQEKRKLVCVIETEIPGEQQNDLEEI